MVAFVMGWLVGLAGFFMPPDIHQRLFLIIAAGILLLQRPFRGEGIKMLAGVLLGLAWAWSYWVHHAPLSIPAYAQPVEVSVAVDSLPVRSSEAVERLKVRAHIVQAPPAQADWVGAQVQVSAYGKRAAQWQPQAGEQWHLLLKLKPIHGWVNFTGFDYEAWAFQQGLQANAAVQRVLGKTSSGWHHELLRAAFQQKIASVWHASPFAGLYDALTYGERSGITSQQWHLFQQTGTVHLLAISGLHLGMVAALGYGLFFWLWRAVPTLHSSIARPHFAALGMVVLATGYLVLSGMGIPALRAWVMVVLVALLLWRRRYWHPWALLALAAFVITLVHPPSVLSPGFWLSFVAVVLIFALLAYPPFKQWGRIKQLLAVQLVLAIGLAPVVGYFFQQSAGLASVVNLLLVPLLPLILLGLALASGLALLWPAGAQTVIAGLDEVWQQLFWLMQHAASLFPPVALHWPLIAVAAWVLVVVGILVRWPMAWTSTLLAMGLASILLNQPVRPVWGGALVTVLDVGQGQAVVVETQDHVLVYDAGPKWGRLDGGEAVVSHLRAQGWSHIDRLVVSHNDIDHAGGAETMLASVPVRRLDAGQPEFLHGAQACTPQSWAWDGVYFAYLPCPPFTKDNDRSCILKIWSGKAAMLMAGDLSARGERWVAQHVAPTQLKATWVLANHHGSATSNSAVWLDGVQPEQIAVSAGFGNYFHHPAASVKARWLARGLAVHCTGCEGALRYRLSPEGVQLLESARRAKKAVFRHFCRQNMH